jgi:hypothetical protein
MKVISMEATVFLEPAVNEMINHWIDMAEGEVSGLGLVDLVPGGFLVKEVFLPDQACTPASSTIEPEAVAKLLLDLDQAGYEPSKLRFWFHSHADMDVFWSSQDTTTMMLMENREYVISMVGNKRGKRLARVDFYHPFEAHIDDVPIQVQLPDLGLKSLCKQMFVEKVKEAKRYYEKPMILEKWPAEEGPLGLQDDLFGMTAEEWEEEYIRRLGHGILETDRDF